MAKYSNFPYSGAVYGEVPTVPESAEPMYSVATGYSTSETTNTTVLVKWQEPTGKGDSWNSLRLVRNQNSFPETPEDGLAVWSFTYVSGGVNRVETSFLDGKDPLVPAISHNRYAYYTMWLLRNDGEWVEVGNTYTVVASPHGVSVADDGTLLTTHDKVMDYLPRVFTSASQSPIDEVDKESTLYNFLSGFSFTFDEMLTYADLLIPDASGKNLNPNITPTVAQNLGIEYVGQMATKSQKRLIREAIYTYSRKGTALSLGNLAESVTGLAPVISYSPNLMLSVQDSTFYHGVGFWRAVGPCTFATANTELPPVDANAIDVNWTGKAVVTTAGASIQNGTDRPRTRGIPVTAGTEYELTFYIKSAATTPTIDISITWYDFLGEAISTSTSSAVSVSSSWAEKSLVATAPTAANFAGITVEFNTAGTYYVDMFQFAESGNVFNETRGVEVTFLPKKINFLNNPSFEDGTTGWTVDDGTAITTPTDLNAVPSGTEMLELTGASSSGAIRLTEFQSALFTTPGYYTFSFYAKASASTSGTLYFWVQDSGFVHQTLEELPITLTTSWARYSIALKVEDTTTFPISSMFFAASIQGNFSGKTINLDAAQIEFSPAMTDYFDGDSSVDSSWVGTAHASESIYYPNWTTKIPLLSLMLQNNIPSNTPWAINLYGLDSLTGITP